MKAHPKAYLLTAFVVLFWSTVPSAFKLSLKYLSVLQLLFFSSLTSLLVLFFILSGQRKGHLLRSFKFADYRFSALQGFLNPFLFYLLVLKAYDLLPAQQAQPLNLTWGIILVLLSIPILKQAINWRHVVAVFLAFLGVLVISIEGDFSYLVPRNPLGVGLALLSAFFFAFYWTFNVKDRRDPLVRTFVNFSFGFLYVLPVALIVGIWENLHILGILGAVYVGIFEMGLTFVLWLKALKYSQTTSHVTIFIYLIPFISFVFIHFFVGETILPSSIIGAFLIVAAIVIHRIREFSS